ncbi:beta-lactamase family protein [Aestuariibacter sp. AA17]|uniref:Beta-lactamase family protein n=1 Tax=Fluctibacter corallii TaxID=2984329 RepID=A0ABT3A536_9ALTE|nr:serine hydrolase [Aestuariibacter sp. AA17]MCV2883763.1 beta-lactamase family protein [Aestuariibacter sp. AA17]
MIGRAAIVLTSLFALHTLANTPLSDFEGLYEYTDSSTLTIVAGPNNVNLYAIINGARYPLTPHKPDIFINSADIQVAFIRDKSGHIYGYRELREKKHTENPIFKLIDSSHKLPPSIWIAKPSHSPSPYSYRPPSEQSDGISVRSLAPNLPLTRQLTSMTNAIYNGEFPYTHSVLLYLDGELVFEEYFYEFDDKKLHQLRSATKTLVAILTGIAVDKGLLNLDTPILQFFPHYQPIKHYGVRKKKITIKDLLTMQSGLACNDRDEASPGNERYMYPTQDWVRFVLDLPMAAGPGNHGHYCSGNVVLLSHIIETVSGLPLNKFANQYLFTPLNINSFSWQFIANQSDIHNFGQAWLSSRDMLKIGVLLLQNGKWKGQSIVSEDWIKALKAPQSQIEQSRYGYLFWLRYLNLDNNERIGISQMSGNGGQKVIILDDYDAVIVFTGGNYNQQSHTNVLLKDFILNGFSD